MNACTTMRWLTVPIVPRSSRSSQGWMPCGSPKLRSPSPAAVPIETLSHRRRHRNLADLQRRPRPPALCRLRSSAHRTGQRIALKILPRLHRHREPTQRRPDPRNSNLACQSRLGRETRLRPRRSRDREPRIRPASKRTARRIFARTGHLRLQRPPRRRLHPRRAHDFPTSRRLPSRADKNLRICRCGLGICHHNELC